MYKWFAVKDFRGLKSLEMHDLGRINLVTGKNNVGKTTLLEALFLHVGAWNPELAVRLSALRGIEKVRVRLADWEASPWDGLFRNFDPSAPVRISGKDTVSGHRRLSLKLLSSADTLRGKGSVTNAQRSGEQHGLSSAAPTRVLRLDYSATRIRRQYDLILDSTGYRVHPIPPAPPFDALFLSSRSLGGWQDMANRYAALQRAGRTDVLLKALQVIEPSLKGLEMVVEGGEPILHGDLGIRRLVPLPLMGEGIVRLAHLTLAVANTPKGVVLVDEIDNGLHYSVLEDVWRGIQNAARDFDAQVFSTTHSRECIGAAHQAFHGSTAFEFRLHRLERAVDKTEVYTYDADALEGSIIANLEIR